MNVEISLDRVVFLAYNAVALALLLRRPKVSGNHFPAIDVGNNLIGLIMIVFEGVFFLGGYFL